MPKMPKIVNDVMDGLSGTQEKEKKHIRALGETEVERLGKEHKKLCSSVVDKLDTHIRSMGDRGYSEEEVVSLLDAHDSVKKLLEMGAELIQQYRDENASSREVLEEKAKHDEEKKSKKNKVDKLVKDRLGIPG